MLILSSYSKVAQDERLEDRFFDTLRFTDKKYQQLIPSSRAERKECFNELLKIVIKSVYCLETMRPNLKNWVSAGLESGLRERDFTFIAQSLIWSLEERLGEAFSDEVKNSWLNLCQKIILVLDEILESTDCSRPSSGETDHHKKRQ